MKTGRQRSRARNGGRIALLVFLALVVSRGAGAATVKPLSSGRLLLDASDGRVEVEVLPGASAGVSVERASSLKLAASDATVSIRGVAKLLPMTLRGCTGELDLVETLGSLAVSVALGSRIDFRIAEPCEVQAGGPGAKLGESIACSGCDLKLPNHPQLGRPRQYYRGTRRAILALTLDENSRVTIDAK